MQHLIENVKDEVDFLPAGKHQRFLQIGTIILAVWSGIDSQITQNNKFDFSHADKHKSLLQTDTMILIVMVKHSQSSQNSK